jgi:hypothetical protein
MVYTISPKLVVIPCMCCLYHNREGEHRRVPPRAESQFGSGVGLKGYGALFYARQRSGIVNCGLASMANLQVELVLDICFFPPCSNPLSE